MMDEKKYCINDYLKLVRIKQWIKNILIFLPMFAGHQIELLSFSYSLFTFFCFSLCASSIYIVNDLFDLNNDRLHHIKRNRPIANGQIDILSSVLISFACFLIGGTLALAFSVTLFEILFLYVCISVSYTLWLKKVVIIDVLSLSILYLIRVAAGVEVLDLDYSPWLFGFLMFIFLTLSLIKRISEIQAKTNEGVGKVSGRGYYIRDLPMLQVLASVSSYSAAVIFYLYINSERVQSIYSSYQFLWIAMVVLVYWVSSILLKSHRGEIDEDPIQFVLTDISSLITGAIFFTIVMIAALF